MGTPKLLCRAKLGSSIGDIGTVPTGKVWTVEFIHVASFDSVARTVNLHHRVSGDGSSDDTNALTKLTPIYPGDAWQFGRGMNWGAADKFTGLCSSADKVIVSVYGIEHTDVRLKLLARGRFQSSIGDIGSAVPASKAWKVSLVHLTSLESTVARTFRLHHRAVADADDLSNALFYDSPMPATDIIETGKAYELATGDKFKALASAADKINAMIYGIEYSA